MDDLSSLREKLIIDGKDFLEVNLQENKVKIYQTGIKEKELSILKSGDPQEWGGTASGLYESLSRYVSAFSVVAEVYLPWAVHFYGKYYLHGEPYFWSGDKYISESSGGCIQLRDEDAKIVYEFAKKGIPILVIDKINDYYKYNKRNGEDFPDILAQNYLVADIDSGFVFAKKNIQQEAQIASLTKLMTAAVVAENVDLRKSVTISERMLNPYGFTKGLIIGQSFRVVELFYPLLIESSNDSAESLTYFLGGKRTVELMNEKAKAIMMQQTSFADPSGYDPKNISTVQDLFYLVRYITNERPLFWKITKGEAVRAFGENRFQNLENKNLFFDDENFIGGKTGYILTSGYNGLFLFDFKGKNGISRRVAIIILNSNGLKEGTDNLQQDTRKIISWLKENYFY
ncbi:MAG: L,D-transpeptidase family protein [bacterium]|nr:L,D-transpeptidase family protein [bacterium]